MSALTCLANSPLVEQVTFKQGATARMTTTKQYDALNRLTNQVSAPEGMGAGSYGLDGNLTSDSRWENRWDDESRVISMESLSDAPAGSKRRLTFEYDWQGRRIVKAACVWTNEAWSVVLSNKFLYDGWNLVAELNATNNALIRSYLWGLELSGQAGPALNGAAGAGGVGGLVAVAPPSGAVMFAAYDRNGDVTGVFDAAMSNWVARYEYGPFGEVVRATYANPFVRQRLGGQFRYPGDRDIPRSGWTQFHAGSQRIGCTEEISKRLMTDLQQYLRAYSKRCSECVEAFMGN